MEERRCCGCMEPLEKDGICPYCGYDNTISNESCALPAGAVLKGQYLVGKVLGKGSFGITYMGWDRYLEIPVVIREYFPSDGVNRDCRFSAEVSCGTGELRARFANNKERFMREAKMLARLSDIPEIVQIKTFFLANNTAYIIMEYIRGITLKECVRLHGKLSAGETFQLLKPVMKALVKVHRTGLVHRDINPENIMIQDDGRVRLLDFGAVRDVGAALPDRPAAKSAEAILKQGFTPIEQYQSQGALGPWTDVYAVCAVFYYCITGDVPTDAASRILGDEVVWFAEKEIDIPPGMETVLKAGMELRSESRIQDMDTLCHRLEQLVERPAVPVRKPGRTPKARLRRMLKNIMERESVK